MKRLPLYYWPGHYCYIARTESEIRDITKIAKNTDTILYTVNFDYPPYQRISEAEAQTIEAPYLPMWVEDEDNFDKILAKEYHSLRPLSAEVIPSMNCPFRCEECSYRPVKEKIGVWQHNEIGNSLFMMSESICRIAILRLHEAGVKHIVFTGGGEPLMNRQITLLGMDLCNKFNIKFGLYTNGLLLTKECVEEILQRNPEFIRISIYGAEGNRFTQYTNVSSDAYKTIIDNAINTAYAAEEKRKTHVSLSFLVHPVLFPDPSDINEVLNSFSMKDLKLFYTIRFTPAVDYYNDNQFPKEYFEKVFSEVKMLKNRTQLSNIITYDHRVTDLFLNKRYQKCYANGLYAEVSCDGTMYLCCEYVGRDRFDIGNISLNSIDEIWASNKRKTVIESLNDCMSCPKVCKPHEINKQIHSLIEGNKTKEDLIRWRDSLIEIANNIGYHPGKLNAYES